MSWGLSNSLEAKWYLGVLKEAIDVYGKPEIVNTDQGSQYTYALWIQFREKQEFKVSMDGKGRALDNVWLERFWRPIKYDYIYLNPCNDGFELACGLQNRIEYYNKKIHHTTKQKPDILYKSSPEKNAT
ncbi:MAG TPA: integrase core domain-containing protein [Luteibaculaceae bacterium]|nr:integrase core domain-containing protein [Luteibaculaceae bacterium]